MAIYHLSMQIISASKGKTAIASASYRSGEQLHSEKEDKNYFYKRDILPETFILKPEHAPEWALDRERLWNEVEKIEKAKNSQYAREMNIALPGELSNEEQQKLILSYCQETFVEQGMVADVAIHRDDKSNPHAHIMLTMRPFNEDGSWGKKQEKIYHLDEQGNKIYNPKSRTYKCSKKETTNWNRKETLNEWRKEWARFANKALKENGIDEEISHLSYEEQGVDKVATKHEGYGEKGEENKKLNQQAKEVNKLKDKLKSKEEEVQINRSYNLLTKELTDKEKERLKELSQSLKTYVNISSIEDKKRMLNNWKTSVLGKELLGEEQSKIIQTISSQEKDILLADEILLEASKKLVKKNYPYINMEHLMDNEIKNIAEVTLKNGNVLEQEELEVEIQNFRPHLLEKQIVLISKQPYISWINLQHQKEKKTEILSKVLKQYGQTIATITKVDDPKTFYGKDFTNIQILSKDITRIRLAEKTVQTFYEDFMGKVFPQYDKSMPIEKMEDIYRVVSYMNPNYSELSIDQVDSWLEKTPQKFTKDELDLGLKIIEGTEFITMVSNPELKRVLSDYSLKSIFINECMDHKDIKNERIEKASELMNDEQKKLTEDRRTVEPEYKNVVYKPESFTRKMRRVLNAEVLISLFGTNAIEEARKKRNQKMAKLQKTMQSKNTMHR